MRSRIGLNHVQVLHPRQRSKQATALRHQSDLTPSNLMRGKAPYLLAFPQHGAGTYLRLVKVHDGADERCLAHAIAPKQCNDLARLHIERNAVEDMSLAIEAMKILYLKHSRAPSPGKHPERGCCCLFPPAT